MVGGGFHIHAGERVGGWEGGWVEGGERVGEDGWVGGEKR